MKIMLPFFIAGSLALGGGGVAVVALNLHTASPRIMAVGIVASVLGTFCGALGLRRLRTD
jgi:hypothetical protein